MNDTDTPTTPTARVLQDIAAERGRQIAFEGWTTEHDDAHEDGELAGAAMCYACPPQMALRARENIDWQSDIPPDWWPWAPEWWKPSPADRRRELVKAAALLVAEIERMDRAAT